MAKANKKSLEAKAYINGQVNDMREKFRKAPDDEARKQLIENFRETTSSDEYKEQLKVVNDDTDIVRKYARRKKGDDLISQEFKDAKTEFYGKDMDLEFGEEFEKLKLGERVNYIFDKFGDTDYAASLIIDLLNPRNYYKIIPTDPQLREFEKWYKTNVLREMLGDNKLNLDTIILSGNSDFYKKFGYGDVALTILKFLLESFNGRNRYPHIYKELWSKAHNGWYNVSEKTIKSYLDSKVDGVRSIGEKLLSIQNEKMK